MSNSKITAIYQGDDIYTYAADGGNYVSLFRRTDVEGYAFKGFSLRAVVIGRDYDRDAPSLAQPLLTLKHESDLDDLIKMLQMVKEHLIAIKDISKTGGRDE